MPNNPGFISTSRVWSENLYIKDAVVSTFYYGNLWFWQWLLVMFILLFMLMEGPMLTLRVVEIFGPSQEAQAHAVRALSDMAQQVRTYLVWRTIVNFFLAIILGLSYKWFGLRQAWTWAILTAVLCYVPYIGPIAAGVLPILEGFILISPCAGEILMFYALIMTLEGYVIVPIVMGRSMDLNATTVMLACMFWEVVWGLPGLFLAMPLMAAVKAVCNNVPNLKPWANLMSTRATDPASDKVELDRAGSPMEETQNPPTGRAQRS